jgi:hypothetical protein
MVKNAILAIFAHSETLIENPPNECNCSVHASDALFVKAQ